jgi:hypothetical protein
MCLLWRLLGPVIAVRTISFNIHEMQFAMSKQHDLAGLRNAGEVCFLVGRNWTYMRHLDEFDCWDSWRLAYYFP